VNQPTLDRSAAVALGLAGTALPFADSPQAEVDRWLRILSVHGDASLILSSAGFTDAAAEAPTSDAGQGPAPGGVEEPDAVTRVSAAARARAVDRGAGVVETSDVLMAVAEVYGDAFDRVLRAHGSSQEEVLELLAVESPE